MNEYCCKVLKPLVDMFEVTGLNMSPAFEQVSFDRDYLKNQKHWVSWEEGHRLIVGMREQFPSDEAFFQLVKDHYGVTSNYWFMRALAKLVMNPRDFYLKPGILYTAKYIPVLEVDSEELEDGRIRVFTGLVDGFEGSELFFELCAYAYAALPKLIGLPPSEVEFECTDQQVVCWMTPPKSQTFISRIKLAVMSLTGQQAIFEHIERDAEAMTQQHRKLKRLGRELQLLLDQAQNAMILVKNERIHYANDRAQDFFNIQDGVQGSLQDLIGESDWERVQAWLSDPAVRHTPCRISVTHSGFTRKAVAVTQEGLLFEDEPVIVLTLREVTREHELERKLLQSQQDQRNEIARELHDDLGQQLTAVSMILESLPAEEIGPAAQEQFRLVKETVESSHHTCKSIAMGLSSVTMTPASLAAELERMISTFRSSSTDVSFETRFDVPI